jgi:peptide/nickel transport system permease protein
MPSWIRGSAVPKPPRSAGADDVVTRDTEARTTPSEALLGEEREDTGGVIGDGTLAPVGAVTTDGKAAKRGRGLSVGAWIAIGWMALVVGGGVLAKIGILPIDSPTEQIIECARRGPLADAGGAAGHLLGCDADGHDMVAQLLYGGFTSMLVATGAVLIGFIVGGTLGMAAGFFGGRIDTMLSAIFNILLSIPAIVLALALVAFLQKPPSTQGGSTGLPAELILIIAIGLVAIPLLARITRASALSWAQRDFVLAARAQGAKNLRIMWREVLPNVLPAMFSIALLGIAIAIVAEGTLSILGVGVRRPAVSWGTIIATYRPQIQSGAPHIALEPSFLIFFTVLALNYLGDVVRARFDVREAAI